MQVLADSFEPSSSSDQQDAAEHLLLEILARTRLDALPDGDVDRKQEVAVVGRRRVVRVAAAEGVAATWWDKMQTFKCCPVARNMQMWEEMVVEGSTKK